MRGMVVLAGAVAGCSFIPGGNATVDARGGDAGRQDGMIDAGSTSAYGTTIGSDNPIAYWPLNEASGATQAFDREHLAPGTYQPACVLGVPGAIAGSTGVRFDGNTCWIDVGTHAEFLFGSNAPYTVEAWVKPDNPGKQFMHVFTHETRTATGPLTGYAMLLDDNQHAKQERAIEDGQSTNYSSSYTADVGVGETDFTYLVATFDGTTQVIYSNVTATQQVTSNVDFGGTPVDAFIGASGSNGNQFAGVIDDVAIYAYALSPAQLQAHFAAR